MRIAFHDFVLDLDQRRLSADGREVHLQPKAFELLKALVESRPRALSKDEILAGVWPGTFVNENSLATVVRDLRDALGDDAQAPRYIRTVHGFGYAFISEALELDQADAPPLSSGWRLIHDHREIRLREGDNILGRTGDEVVILDSPTVSRHHAVVRVQGAQATVADLGSKNGTWLGTTGVTTPVPLTANTELRLGSVVLVVRFATHVPSTATDGR